MINKIKNYISKLDTEGVPSFVFRDPVTSKGSFTYTAALLSFLIALFATSNSASKALGGLDKTASRDLFIASAVLYLGRKLQKKGEDIEIGGKE